VFLFTSLVVACELRFGARRKGSAALTEPVDQLLAGLEIVPRLEVQDWLRA